MAKIKIYSNMKNKITNIKTNMKNNYENPYEYSKITDIAYPMDDKLLKRMRFAYLDKIINKPIEKIIAIKYGTTISQGLAVNETNFPEIYSILCECCEKLKIDIPYTVIDSKIGMHVTTVGTDNKCFIMLPNMLSEYVTHNQLEFILGHQCAHIAMKHMLFHTAANLGVSAGKYIPGIGSVFSMIIDYPIKIWARCSDITADRLGLLCCQDYKAAQSSLLKIIAGFKNIDDINVDDYISNAENILSELNWSKYMECDLDSPLVFKRLKALEYFYHSEVYYSVLEIDPPNDINLLTKDELNEKTKELITIK